MALQQQVSHNVRLIATARGTTPTQAARQGGMTAERLHAKLSGRVRWNVEDLELLASALQVTAGDLVSPSLMTLERPRQDSNLQPTGWWSGRRHLELVAA